MRKNFQSCKIGAEQIGRPVVFILLALLTVVMAYPFWFILIYSFSDSLAAMSGNVILLPTNLSLAAFHRLFNIPTMWTSYMNSIVITVTGTTMAIILSVTVAYPLSVSRLKWRSTISLLLYFTMLFSGGMIPNYLLIKELGLLNNRWALILPGLGSAYNILILRNFFQSIPSELEESASIDGATPLRILINIILPVSMPAIAVQAMFYGVTYWNNFFDSVLYIDNISKISLQAYLRTLMTSGIITATAAGMDGNDSVTNAVLSEETMRMAAIAAAVIPVLIVYPVLQRYYVKGIIVGSVKG
jgi:putative aldouronate transport system permease protein